MSDDSNERYAFGAFSEGDLRGADLSYLPFNKRKFLDAVSEFDLTPAQKQGLWDYYTKLTGEDYNRYMLSQEKELPTLSRESLKDLKIEAGAWPEEARRLGIDPEVAGMLFETYVSEITGLLEERIEAQETARAEQQAQQQEAGDDDFPELTDSDLNQMLSDIRQDPAYFSTEAKDTARHDRLVWAHNVVAEMKAGLRPRSVNYMDSYVAEYRNEQKEALQENYGVSGDVNKGGQFSSSNKIPPSRSEDDRHGSVDTPKRDADRSSASGHKISDGGAE